MRTDARIFRVASPLGLGRCCTGGGGCWLCGGTQTWSHPCPCGPHLAPGATAAPGDGPKPRARAGWSGGPSVRPVPLGREPVTHSCARPLTPAPASPGAEWVRALSPKAPLARRGTSDPDTVPGAWTLTGPSLGRHPGGAAAKGAQASYPPTRGQHMSFRWGAEGGRGVLAGNPERRPTEERSPLLTPRAPS